MVSFTSFFFKCLLQCWYTPHDPFSFCLSLKFLFPLPIVRDSLLNIAILFGSYFPSGVEIHHSMASLILQFLLRNLMGLPVCVTCWFSLVSFHILSLFCVFHALTIIWLGEFLFLSCLFGVLKASGSWVTISFSKLGTFSDIVLFYWICFYDFDLYLLFFYDHDS
jgi:hypothetical protein